MKTVLRIILIISSLICFLSETGCSRWTSRITSDPSGAEVFLNGNYIGKSPFNHKFIEHAGTLGTHTLSFNLDGYKNEYYIINDDMSLNVFSSDEYPANIHVKFENPIQETHIKTTPPSSVLSIKETNVKEKKYNLIGKSWAVIIGISRYKHSTEKGLTNLIFADDDA